MPAKTAEKTGEDKVTAARNKNLDLAIQQIAKDYGEGASVIQERSYAYALKSSMWLLDPRPSLPTTAWSPSSPRTTT